MGLDRAPAEIFSPLEVQCSALWNVAWEGDQDQGGSLLVNIERSGSRPVWRVKHCYFHDKSANSESFNLQVMKRTSFLFELPIAGTILLN